MKHRTITIREIVHQHTREYRKLHNLSDTDLLQKILDDSAELQKLAAQITTGIQTVRVYRT